MKLCKVGIHKYKFNIESEYIAPFWAIRFWSCIYCNKPNHVENGKCLSRLKNAVHKSLENNDEIKYIYHKKIEGKK